MVRFILVTGNKGKVKEFLELLSGLPIEIVGKEPPKGVEKGNSYEENALLKARSIAGFSKDPVIAEDSGLEVKGLGWGPGVFSSRFFGEGLTDREKCLKLLELLEGKDGDERMARFVSCIALVDYKKGIEKVFRGEVYGLIAHELRGSSGFGYDPIFIFPEYGKTFAELGLLKNTISHRKRALDKLRKFIEENYVSCGS